MANERSQRLVIDASIARSCGGKEATYPTSVNCRDFLQSVLEICHQVVMTPNLRAEWDKHQSRFAKEWLRQMIARRKLVPLLLDDVVDADLWQSIEALAETDVQRSAMVKDLHLVEAAIASDKIVASLDDKMRDLLSHACSTVNQLQEIMWVNPDHPEEDCLDWLQSGAEVEPKRCLKHWAKP